ncbi:MAG: hypothetical protein NTU41_00530, partial [Chloroflexi bacterium]|nr:hypothetical protein [Chloroflexota bacterium]
GQISRVESLSAIEGIQEFVQELRLIPMPMPRQGLPMPRRWRGHTKQDTSKVETKEEPTTSRARVAFVKVTIDGQEIPQVISMVAGRIHDLEVEVELPGVEGETRDLHMLPVSTLPEEEYLFPRPSVCLLKGTNKYHVKGYLQFKHAQSEYSKPIDIDIDAFLHKVDGTNEPCTVFGQSHLKFRVLDGARLSAQGLAQGEAVEKVLKGLSTFVGGIALPSHKNEREVITCMINYAGYELCDPSFTDSETDEKDFQKDMSRYLSLSFGRAEVLSEVRSGRGFLDVLARGVPVELKVFRGRKKLEDFAESSLPQVTQYVVSQGCRLGLLCILDISERTTATPSLIDDVSVRKGRTERGIDPSPLGTIDIVTIVVHGALYPASKLRS